MRYVDKTRCKRVRLEKEVPEMLAQLTKGFGILGSKFFLLALAPLEKNLTEHQQFH